VRHEYTARERLIVAAIVAALRDHRRTLDLDPTPELEDAKEGTP
jgi:hypothetical protein